MKRILIELQADMDITKPPRVNVSPEGFNDLFEIVSVLNDAQRAIIQQVWKMKNQQEAVQILNTLEVPLRQ